MSSGDTEVEAPAATPVLAEALFAPSAAKLVLLGATTFGVYISYWFYRNWIAIRLIEGRPGIMPAWRTAFLPLWVYSALRRLAAICGVARLRAVVGALVVALVFWIALLCAIGSVPGFLLLPVLVISLLPVNLHMSRHKRALGIARSRRERFSVWNWLWIVPIGSLQGLAVTYMLLLLIFGWHG